GGTPPRERRSAQVIPPRFVLEVQTPLPVAVSVISRLSEMALAAALPLRTSPYSRTVPVKTASAPSALPRAITSSFEGVAGTLTAALTSPRFVSPVGRTYTPPLASSIVEKTSRTRSPARLSRLRLENGSTITV